ncbi:MAG: hypothetical protein D6692_07065 [Planctomycetota bacterium]|nr:MAG: hypothetical protein D6692_07065 [Planctomycetota bacterium]
MRRKRTSDLSLKVLLGVAAGLTARAHAQFTVTEHYDASAVNPVAGPDVLPAVPGDQITIRSAIEHINTLPPGNYTVDIPAGTYLLSLTGHNEEDAHAGDIDIRNGVTVTGAGLGVTFILGTMLGDRIFDVKLPVQAEFRMLGMYEGTAVPGTAGVESGGAVRTVAGSTLRLFETEFSNNSASGGTAARGGAIDCQGDLFVTGFNSFYGNSAEGIGGTIYLVGRGEIDNSHFMMNHSDRDGGAIRTSNASPGLRVTNSTFDFNTSGGSGGAMNLRAPSEVIACRFNGNDATAVGGAVGLLGAVVRFESCEFGGNHSASGGGAINVAGLGDATLLDCVLRSNASDTSGGGLINSSVCRVLNSSIVENTCLGSIPAELGGAGIYNFGDLQITNSTISRNFTPGGLGGGILNLTGGNAVLTHVTVFANEAPIGSQIHNGTPSGGAAMAMTHTVIADVRGGGGRPPFVDGTSLPLVSLGYNLDADGSGGLVGPGDIAGLLAAPIDPLISPLLMGPNGTVAYRPLPGSPCLDGGDAGFSIDPNGNTVMEDQFHAVRPVRRPDIGAIEADCAADLASPYLVLNFFDIAAYLSLYNNHDPAADLATPFGIFNFFDVAAYLALYNAGCP